MTIFYALASLLTLLVLVWLLRPLLSHPKSTSVSSRQLNLAIYREQLAALDAELARGAMGAQEHAASRDELHLRMLDDVPDTSAPVASGNAGLSSKATAMAIAFLIVGGAGSLYRWLGSPESIDRFSAQQAQSDEAARLVEGLAQKLQANPDDLRGWSLLARSYKITGRMDDAIKAYGKVGTLMETDPDVMADYADLLAMQSGDGLQGRPIALVRRALQINPRHPPSLMLAAVHAFREGKYQEAIRGWETLLTLVDPQSPDAQELGGYIAQARQKAGLPEASGRPTTQAAAPGQPDNAQILQMVERLATRLKDNPEDVEGWARLARSYKVLGRLDESASAYEKAAAVVNRTPDMLTDYADVLAMRNNGNLEGKPLVLVNKALQLEPKHPMALMLSGTAAYRKGDFNKALAQWKTLSGIVAPGSPEAQWAATSIADAQAQVAATPTPR